MPLIFENGIKFIFLLILTGAYSKNYYKQDRNYREQSNYYQREEDSSDRDQYYHSQQIQWEPDQTERHYGNRGQSQRYQRYQDRTGYTQDRNTYSQDRNTYYQDRSYSKGDFLSRLLDSSKRPVLVFITPKDGDRYNQRQNSPADTAVANYSPENSDREQYYPADPAENDAYILYNLLRSTQADEDLDVEAEQQFELTKDLLRSSFALRCGQKAACESKCPAKKRECPVNCQNVEKEVKNECRKKCPETPRKCKKTCEELAEEKADQCETKVEECEEQAEEKCESKCQKVFDELDACPRPKKKKSCGPKCGRTMPPNWLLRSGLL